MSVAASGAEDVMAEKSIKALNAEITALRQELKDARQHGEALEAEISSLRQEMLSSQEKLRDADKKLSDFEPLKGFSPPARRRKYSLISLSSKIN